jgi:hypothetical protein
MSTPVGGSTGQSWSAPPPLPLSRTAVRQLALAVSVLDDIDIIPADDGLVLPGVPDVFVSTADIGLAIRDAEPETTRAQSRLARWLRVRRALAERSLDELGENLRPVALPVDHELHDGPTWVRQRVLGGSLDIGPGFVRLDTTNPDRVVVVPQSVLDATGVDVTPWWRGATEYLENMGALATSRWRRAPKQPLRPMGDCDVVTLLASAVFRGALCADVGGMRAVAVPVRHRGWLELSRIDPAFAQAAAAIASDEERGFARPVLLTVDEVAVARPGGNPASIVLRDAATDEKRWLRDVLYH